MFRFVLCLVFIILRAEASIPESENPVIHLSYAHDDNKNYVVWKDKPLKIIIEDGSTRYIWCNNQYVTSNGGTFELFVPETKFSNGKIQILNVTHVTAEMSTRWACTALEEYHGPLKQIHRKHIYTASNLHFKLHVKGARAVNLIANNQSLTYVTTNLSVNYDGEANYTYGEGEDFPMDFSCEKVEDDHTEDTLRLEYYNADGILLFQTEPREKRPHFFRTVLKSNNDKFYLDCIRATLSPEREYRYRTTFYRRDSHSVSGLHAVTLSVNGQKLTSTLKIDKSYDDYIFKYIDGEVLTVTCKRIYFDMRGSLVFYSNIVHDMSKTHRNSWQAVISLNTSITDIKNKSLTCGINNTNVVKPNARILFLSDVPDYDVRIRGLPRHNILYQYTGDEDHWIIEYQYSMNESLDLTCVWHEGTSVSGRLREYSNPFMWKSKDHSFDSAAVDMPNTPIKFSEIILTTNFNETHNGTKIECTYFPRGYANSKKGKTVEIILRLKPDFVPEANKEEDPSGDNLASITVPIAVGVAAIIGIIMMICLVSWRKRTKRVSLIENAYDNLSNQNNSPIPPFPSQWEDNYNDPNYAKIDEEVMQENYNYSTDNDKINSTPYKRQSNTSENHYTEIDDYFKAKADRLTGNWKTVQPSKSNKQIDTPKATASHSPNNASFNSFGDSNQHIYDKIRHNNLPNNNGNENYVNVQKPSKSKSVTFRQMSNDGKNNDRKVKVNTDGYYANTVQDEMKPGDMHKNENEFLQYEKSENSHYAEPYDEISYINDFYG